MNINLSFIMEKRFKLRFLRLFFVAGIMSVCVTDLPAQEPYHFDCRDYVFTDNNRAPQSAFSYDDEGNTFTIAATGNMNIAFQMDHQKDGAYYISNEQEWFLVEGSDLSVDKSESNIWWFNGANNPGSQPDYALADGENTLLLWNIKNNPNLNKGMDYSAPTIFITSQGANFFQAMGFTAGNSGRSTISNIAYYAAYEAAANYPALLAILGYTEESLTTEIKSKLDTRIVEAETLIENVADSESKTRLSEAISAAQEASAGLDATDYTTAFSQFKTLGEAIDKFGESVYASGYEKTANGIHAILNEQHIYVMFYNEGIVRVYKSFEETVNKESLSVIMQPGSDVDFDVTDDGAVVTMTTATLNVLYHLATGQIEVRRADATPLVSEKEGSTKFLPYKDNAYDTYQISHAFMLDDDEAIFGLGQIQNGALNQRGQSIYLHQENMKVSIPYFYSSKNYALFWDNYSPTTFTDNSEGTSFTSTGTAVDYYILCGANSDEVLAQMRELTGQSPMPALWNFGLYQSKERYVSADETMNVVKEYRRLGVPLDCIVQDWQYWGDNYHWNALEFLNPTFANYEEMIETVHENNAKLMISIWANFGPETSPFKELDAMGRLIPVNTYPNGYGVRPYDVYGQKARDTYWKYLYNGLVSKGIDAYWMDSSEPDYYQVDINDFDYVTEDGKTWRSVRNAFPLAHVGGVYDHHRAAEAAGDAHLAGKRVAILTRSAFAGQQRYGANTWSGDVTSSWENFAAQIPAACNLSVCGIPYWNSDIGGFFTWNYPNGVNDPAWRQLYLRWAQFGTFTPMMRFHGTGTPREIYQFGSAGDGKGDFDQLLKYVKIRYRLLPYLYSTAWQVCHYGKTFMRSLPVAFNADRTGYDITDEYMFGDAFLVAPVVTEGNAARNVYLPSGQKWINFWTGETIDGGQTVVNRGSNDQLPLFVKAGSILPWGPDVQYSTEKSWDSLEVRVYPGADGSFILYEDENDNYNYEKGKYTEIPFVWDEAAQTLTIGARKGDFDGMLEKRVFKICKVSTRRGTGDLHETSYHAVVEYTGEAVTVNLEDRELQVVKQELNGIIVNPSFEMDGTTLMQRAPQGWTVDCNASWWGVNRGGGTGDPSATDGDFIFGVWDSANNRNATISQTITLPSGHYQLAVDMHVTNQGNKMRVGNQRLFAGESFALFKDQVLTVGSTDNEPLQTIVLDFFVAENDTPVEIGVTTDGAQEQTWYKIDNFRLYKIERPCVVLDENKPLEVEDLLLTDVCLHRKMEGGVWEMFCVPFDIDEITCMTLFSDVKQLKSVGRHDDVVMLDFTASGNVVAGVPYIVRMADVTDSCYVSDVLIKPIAPAPILVDGISLKGYYSPLTIETGNYVFDGKDFEKVVSAISHKGYRAFVEMEPGTETDRLLVSIDGVPTTIEKIHGTDRLAVDVYTLDGLCLKKNVSIESALDSLKPGIYIVGGQKRLK